MDKSSQDGQFRLNTLTSKLKLQNFECLGKNFNTLIVHQQKLFIFR